MLRTAVIPEKAGIRCNRGRHRGMPLQYVRIKSTEQYLQRGEGMGMKEFSQFQNMRNRTAGLDGRAGCRPSSETGKL